MMPGGRGFEFVCPVPGADWRSGHLSAGAPPWLMPRLRCHPLPGAAFCTTAIPHEQQCRWDAFQNVNAGCARNEKNIPADVACWYAIPATEIPSKPCSSPSQQHLRVHAALTARARRCCRPPAVLCESGAPAILPSGRRGPASPARSGPETGGPAAGGERPR